ncbi:MAG: hypothetical protein QOI94_3042 [Acidobacteriaceae bacterium]|nr:hypothetical protein [Acidobacteriaceae bacterium]
MGDYKSSHPESYPLDIVERLRETPQLLPHESLKEFHELFASFEDYGKPQNLRDHLAVHQATVLTWDILRCQDMKVGVLRSHHRPALESLLRKIQVRTTPPSKNGIAEAVAKSEARQLAGPWFKDPASRPAIRKTIENPPNAIEVEAFQLALPALAAIERLIVSAQKRLDRFLENLERTSKTHARALRVAAEKAIAQNDAAVLASRK